MPKLALLGQRQGIGRGQTGFVQMATKQENYQEDIAVAEKHATFATGLLRTGGGWVPRQTRVTGPNWNEN